jgi:hypothetical protein
MPALRRRRPALVTWLSLGVLTFSAFYLARAVAGLTLLARPALPLTIPWWYLPLTGILWSGCGLVVAIGLLRGMSWGPHLLRWGMLAYLTWYWLDRLLLARSEYARQTVPASALLTALALALVFGALQQRSLRAYFRVAAESDSP